MKISTIVCVSVASCGLLACSPSNETDNATELQSAAATCAGGWVVATSPNVGMGDNALASVAASSSTDVWAVGQFAPDSDPNSPSFQVRNLKLPGRVNAARLARRRELLGSLDQIRRDIDLRGDIEGLDQFYREGLEMVTNDKALKAFDISKEEPKLRDRYGRHDLGQCCLLARRLVEAGVTFVAIQAGGGWDTHADNFRQLKDNLLKKYDGAVAALVSDIHERGLAGDVLVTSFGEFGRTPRINPGAGRDHWPGAMSILYAGGGLKMGQAIGTTDSKAEYPASKPYTPGCVLSTIYHVLGIDHHHVFYDHARRPLPVLSEGQPIEELL